VKPPTLARIVDAFLAGSRVPVVLGQATMLVVPDDTSGPGYQVVGRIWASGLWICSCGALYGCSHVADAQHRLHVAGSNGGPP